MTHEVFDALMFTLFIGTTIGFYLVYERLVRKWLGVDDVPIPFPAPIRWTLIAGAAVSSLVLIWISSAVV
jgi:hypothetical protein